MAGDCPDPCGRPITDFDPRSDSSDDLLGSPMGGRGEVESTVRKRHDSASLLLYLHTA
jgi:hypothetical protein